MRKEDRKAGRSRTPTGESHPNAQARGSRPQVPELARVGGTITVKGEVVGDEDLLIEGRIEGSVDLKSHCVTVGTKGNVQADIVGRIVTVEGTVRGDLTATEQIVLVASASVEGDLTAPRVRLEGGAYFRGGVVTGDPGAAGESDLEEGGSEKSSSGAQPRQADAGSDHSSLSLA